MAVGIVANLVFSRDRSKASGTSESSASNQQPKTNSAEDGIRAEIASIPTDFPGKPDLAEEQLSFARNALEALHCVQQQSPCTTFVLEQHLKGLPVGWVERALGPPGNEQRLSGRHLYYWSFKLNEDGRSRSYRLQLEFGAPCPLTVNKGFGACTFNFYG